MAARLCHAEQSSHRGAGSHLWRASSQMAFRDRSSTVDCARFEEATEQGRRVLQACSGGQGALGLDKCPPGRQTFCRRTPFWEF